MLPFLVLFVLFVRLVFMCIKTVDKSVKLDIFRKQELTTAPVNQITLATQDEKITPIHRSCWQHS